MSAIEPLAEEIVLILTHEKEIYTKILDQSPEGRLLSEKSNNKVRLLHAVRSGSDASGKPRYKRSRVYDGSPLLRALADKEYAQSALKIIEHDLRVMTSAFDQLRSYSQENIFSGMHQAYRSLPHDCFQASRQAAEVQRMQHAWASEPYEISDYRPEEKIHTTSRGLKVRTRAELLIAEFLYRYDIPFRYEQVVHIGAYTLAPDFTFLDQSRTEFFWDYCGMMGDQKYRAHQLWRRGVYEGAGITEWDNMIYTYDASDAIDMREIEAVIKTKILPRL